MKGKNIIISIGFLSLNILLIIKICKVVGRMNWNIITNLGYFIGFLVLGITAFFMVVVILFVKYLEKKEVQE